MKTHRWEVKCVTVSHHRDHLHVEGNNIDELRTDWSKHDHTFSWHIASVDNDKFDWSGAVFKGRALDVFTKLAGHAPPVPVRFDSIEPTWHVPCSGTRLGHLGMTRDDRGMWVAVAIEGTLWECSATFMGEGGPDMSTLRMVNEADSAKCESIVATLVARV